LTTTFQDVIDRARGHLYSGERDVLTTLTTSVNTSVTSFVLSDITSVQSGAVLSVGIEMCLVTSTNISNKTATVRRAFMGSTAQTHASTDLVWVNPKFPEWSIWKSILEDLSDLSSPVVGLFQMKSTTASYSSADGGYAFAPADLLSIYDVRGDATTGPYPYRRVSDWDYTGSILRASGSPPTSITIRYKAPFVLPSAPTDDVQAVSGLRAEANDLPAIGAAMRLVAPREVKRAFIERQTDARRAEEVPAGAMIGAFRTLAVLRQQRVAAEVARLQALYPILGA
jgi:hypothetical protein